MDQSYDNDLTLSPSQIFERLQVLRQLQLMQQGKLQKQRLEYHDTTESSSNITEIVSHFSSCTSYNTFRSLLELPNDNTSDSSPRLTTSITRKILKDNDLVDGVSILNLSQESEFIINSPNSAKSKISATCNSNGLNISAKTEDSYKTVAKKQISLDEMPILSPKKDFEALILEKLKGEVNKKVVKPPEKKSSVNKKPFLRKGDGTNRYGLQKKDFVIQNTKSLPWRCKDSNTNNTQSPVSKHIKSVLQNVKSSERSNVENIPASKASHPLDECKPKRIEMKSNVKTSKQESPESKNISTTNDRPANIPKLQLYNGKDLPKSKHPVAKGKTWASVLSKEQNDFLQQLKQSDYYKNFVSPSKSEVSNASCDETLHKHSHEKEIAEQNMFELLESKVSHESFDLENSFFKRFLRRTQLETSGESTPVVMQQCLAKNPKLIHIFPEMDSKKPNYDEDCTSEYTDCCSDACSSVSTCCSCNTVEETGHTPQEDNRKKNYLHPLKNDQKSKKDADQKNRMVQKSIDVNTIDKKDGNVTETDMKANMVEMNAKLIATSELLKDRLRELEDEIETFRRENSNLVKMREEIDLERQKFYEEKSLFEQKFNEEKILSEYYLAEEKEKLSKQKQMYEKYVREMRGRLNKKDKDEVVQLKKEVNELKDEIRLKDAKSTSSIARLRNQLRLMEKEKKELQDVIEKLKKENRKIQHSNDMTRRMTNIKYLEEINKKLSCMASKDTQSEINLDSNAKYKSFEIERQSRSRRVQPNEKKTMVRAKSVPNLKVTSRYAKYFSQRDASSDLERNETLNIANGSKCCPSDNEESDNEMLENDESVQVDSENEGENNLEKMYMERFHSVSPKSIRSENLNHDPITNKSDRFFITKSNSNEDFTRNHYIPPVSHSSDSNSRISKSPINSKYDSKSPSNGYKDFGNTKSSSDEISIASFNSSKSRNSKSPSSILSNKTNSSQIPATVINKDKFRDTLNVTPEPTISTTSITKTNLNPTEIKKPDGSKELRFPNGNIKFISADGKYSKFVYYNGDVKENFYDEGRIKYFYVETKTYHTTHADGLEVLEFSDGQVEKRYKDGSSEIRLPNGSVRYFDPKNRHVREEWRFPDGTAVSVSANGEQRIVFSNGQVEVHAEDHKRREFPDGTMKLVYNDGTSETRYASGRIRVKDKHGNLIMDSATR